MKLKHLVSVILLGSFITFGCSEYNSTTVKDKNENSERIYGEKGAPPKQMSNKYETDPQSAVKAKEIKEKLYPVNK